MTTVIYLDIKCFITITENPDILDKKVSCSEIRNKYSELN